jgi:hypothetical protein
MKKAFLLIKDIYVEYVIVYVFVWLNYINRKKENGEVSWPYIQLFTSVCQDISLLHKIPKDVVEFWFVVVVVVVVSCTKNVWDG